jgi:hypothetical protein
MPKTGQNRVILGLKNRLKRLFLVKKPTKLGILNEKMGQNC